MKSKSIRDIKYSVILLLEEANEDFPQFVETLHGLFSSRKEPFEIREDP